MKGYYKPLRRLLVEAGCEFVRQGKGDHEVWRSPITGRLLSVDRGGGSRHTANAILKDAGLPKAF